MQKPRREKSSWNTRRECIEFWNNPVTWNNFFFSSDAFHPNEIERTEKIWKWKKFAYPKPFLKILHIHFKKIVEMIKRLYLKKISALFPRSMFMHRSVAYLQKWKKENNLIFWCLQRGNAEIKSGNSENKLEHVFRKSWNETKWRLDAKIQ